jgi:hypothetical protein
MAVEETVDINELATAQNKTRIRAAIDAVAPPEAQTIADVVARGRSELIPVEKLTDAQEEQSIDAMIHQYKVMGDRLETLKEAMIASGEEDEVALNQCLKIKEDRKALRSIIKEKVLVKYPKANEMLPLIKSQVEELKKGETDMNKRKSNESFKLLERLLLAA